MFWLPPMILFILAIIGFLISSYFTVLSLNWLDPADSRIPSLCRLGQQTCNRVIFSPRARVFGVPNSLLGQLFYVAILIGTVSRLLFVEPFYFLFLSASFLTVLLAIYLSYSLLFLTRIRCFLCFTSHLINLIIFILLVNEKWPPDLF